MKTHRYAFLVLLVASACAQTFPAVPIETLQSCVDQQAVGQVPGATRVGDFLVGAGEKSDFSVMLEAGKCYWFSGVGDRNVERLMLYLWGPPNGNRLADAKPDSRNATLGHCPQLTGAYHFQAKVDGEGQYVIGVYMKVGAPVPPLVAVAAPQSVWGVGPVVIGVGSPYPVAVVAPPTQCRSGADGISACGYGVGSVPMDTPIAPAFPAELAPTTPTAPIRAHRRARRW